MQDKSSMGAADGKEHSKKQTKSIFGRFRIKPEVFYAHFHVESLICSRQKTDLV